MEDLRAVQKYFCSPWRLMTDMHLAESLRASVWSTTLSLPWFDYHWVGIGMEPPSAWMTLIITGLLPIWVGHLAWAKNTPLLCSASAHLRLMEHTPAYPGWCSGNAGIWTQEVYLQSLCPKPVGYAASQVWQIASTLKELTVCWGKWAPTGEAAKRER